MADTAVEAPPQDTLKAAKESDGANGHTGEAAAKTEGEVSTGQAKALDTANGGDLGAVKDEKEEKKEHSNRYERRDSDRGHSRYRQKGRPQDNNRFRKGNFDEKNGKRRPAPYGNRSNLVSEEESSDPVQIRKQVEFYFSDSNLPADKFLFNLVGGHENKPVPLTVIHNFKRMRHFQPFKAVVEALQSSSSLDVVKIEKSQLREDGADDNNNKDKTDASSEEVCIQRKVPLPQGTTSTQAEVQKIFEDAAMARSVYVKGFGEEHPSTQFDIEAFFAEHGPTNAVRLRRAEDKTFKRSVFVEFDSEETAKKFLALDPPPKYRGQDLLIKSKKDYCNSKINDINEGRIRVDDSKKSASGERDWRERREEDKKKGFPPLKDKSHAGKKTGGKAEQEGKKTGTIKVEQAESDHKEPTTAEDEGPKPEAPTRKRSRDDLATYDGEEPTAKKVDMEGAASGDKADENITDAPLEETKVQEEEKSGA